MKTEKKKNYTILIDEKDGVKDFAEYLNSNYDQFKDEHLVVDIEKYGNLSMDELLSFLKLSTKHRQAKKSFVIVNDTINIDAVPEELNVVPTFQEAEDIINLEEIERDLGF
ncbi:MAG: ribonuclease Z [Psychroflexus sp.]